MRYSPTKRQADLLAFIKTYVAKNGLSPTYTEMMAGIELKSKNSVYRLVSGLIERGHIRRFSDRPRSITIVRGSIPR